MLMFVMEEGLASMLVLVLEKGNLDRMKEADPITLNPEEIGGFLPRLLHPDNMSLLIAYEEDTKPLMDMLQKGQKKEAVTYLQRGYKYIEGLDGVYEVHLNPKDDRK